MSTQGFEEFLKTNQNISFVLSPTQLQDFKEFLRAYETVHEGRTKREKQEIPFDPELVLKVYIYRLYAESSRTS